MTNVFLFMDAEGHFIPLYDAAGRLDVTVKQVVDGFELWRLAGYREGFEDLGLIYRPADSVGVGEVLRLKGGGHVWRRLRFSLEVVM